METKRKAIPKKWPEKKKAEAFHARHLEFAFVLNLFSLIQYSMFGLQAAGDDLLTAGRFEKAGAHGLDQKRDQHQTQNCCRNHIGSLVSHRFPEI